VHPVDSSFCKFFPEYCKFPIDDEDKTMYDDFSFRENRTFWLTGDRKNVFLRFLVALFIDLRIALCEGQRSLIFFRLLFLYIVPCPMMFKEVNV